MNTDGTTRPPRTSITGLEQAVLAALPAIAETPEEGR